MHPLHLRMGDAPRLAGCMDLPALLAVCSHTHGVGPDADDEPSTRGGSGHQAKDSRGAHAAAGAEPGCKQRLWRPRLPLLRKGHYTGAVIDAPWTYHAPKLILWCAHATAP
jgi:hypothetical protein